MSAFGMKPSFKDREGYDNWIRGWKKLYARLTVSIREMRRELKAAQRAGKDTSQAQRDLQQERAMATKAMDLLNDAKVRMHSITELRKGIQEQHATFPLEIENVRNMDFHFNKKHLEFPDIVPMWIVKAKGQSFYVNHVDCNTPWTTREQPDNPSTKGAIRIRRGTLRIDAQANAVID